MSSSPFTKCTLPVVLLVITKYSPSQKHIFANEMNEYFSLLYIIFSCGYFPCGYFPMVFHISRRNVNNKIYLRNGCGS